MGANNSPSPDPKGTPRNHRCKITSFTFFLFLSHFLTFFNAFYTYGLCLSVSICHFLSSHHFIRVLKVVAIGAAFPVTAVCFLKLISWLKSRNSNQMTLFCYVNPCCTWIHMTFGLFVVSFSYSFLHSLIRLLVCFITFRAVAVHCLFSTVL